MNKVSALFLGLCFHLCVFSQHTVSGMLDAIVQKAAWYGKKTEENQLFTHTDKNIYNAGETIWLTTYVLNQTADLSVYRNFSVSLVKSDDKKIISTAEFPMSFGIGKGNLTVADTLTSGAYSLLVYTNKLQGKQPESYFIQPITIKSSSIPDLRLQLKPLAEAATQDSVKIAVKLTNKAAMPIANQTINYVFGPLQKNAPIGKIKTDASGEVIIAIASKQLSKATGLLKVHTVKGFDYAESFLQLPTLDEHISVSFYPEGGTIISGYPTVVGIETKDALGAPVQLEGMIYEDDLPVEKVQTNDKGLGKFLLQMDVAKQYSFKVTNQKLVQNGTFALPKSLDTGIALQVKNAVVNDTLEVIVQGNLLRQPLVLLLHNYREVFANIGFELNKNTKRFKVPLTEIPKGLLTLTLLDSAGKPWAERLVFAHYNKRLQVRVSTDSEKIPSRTKAVVKVLVADEAGIPQKGIFSIACVQDARIDSRKASDIESHFYFSGPLKNTPALGGKLMVTTSNINLLEQIILIKGWRKYQWQQLLAVQPADTLQKVDEVQHIANVNKELAKKDGPFTMQILKDDGFEVLQSTEAGTFKIAPTQLQTTGKNVFITVQNKLKEQVPFTYVNPYSTITNQLKPTLNCNGFDFAWAAFKKQAVDKVDLQESVKFLEEVVVTSTVKCTRTTQRNACGDYVCKNGALNCPIHIYCGTPAISGSKYYKGGSRLETYYCDAAAKVVNANALSIKGISLEKIFYEPNYDFDGKDDQLLLSTIYWNGAVVTNDKGEAELKFNTSDLTGKFRITINGMTEKDVFSATSTFLVTKPEKE